MVFIELFVYLYLQDKEDGDGIVWQKPKFNLEIVTTGRETAGGVSLPTIQILCNGRITVKYKYNVNLIQI